VLSPGCQIPEKTGMHFCETRNSALERARGVAEWLRERGVIEPAGLIVLGSGWSGLAETAEPIGVWDYSGIPGLPETTTPGHPGRLMHVVWHGVTCVVLVGRWHVYEGHTFAEAALPGMLAHALRCRWLLSTNAAGGVASHLRVGDLVVAEDDVFLWNAKGFRQRAEERFSHVPRYSELLENAFDRAGNAVNVRFSKGVLAMMTGPCYETPAEVGMIRASGASVVSMSTVPESRWARLAGLNAAAVSCVTNLVPSSPLARIRHDEVLEVLGMSLAKAARLIERWLEDEYVRCASGRRCYGLA